MKIFLFLFLLTASAHAAQKASINLTPILGYEFVDKYTPTPHTHGRFIYGAVITVGYPLIALESQYTHGSDSETFLQPLGFTTTDTSDRIKLGLRSSYNLNRAVSGHLRGGAESNQTQHQEFLGGAQTVNQTTTVYHPYVGVGLGIWVTSWLQLNGEALGTIVNVNDLSQNEYETSVGVAFRF